ncbi:MAG: UDP-N-acetylmuramoyl-tripeptide--D-alanyl-D-alanine ligase, partial [Kurthia sp.]|nr:UDP-N-acetylmuramoyl-tripeptide--D-alanyl-D-alanine ligase [Kurthia sp.]
MKKTVQQVANWLQQEAVNGQQEWITGVSINTRTLQPGDLFIPFKGEKTNGHQYIQQAIEAGAAATLWQKDEPNMPTNIPVILVDDAEEALQQMAKAYRAEHQATFIGITGSNGKTSTKDLLAGTLMPYYKVQKTEGNFNNQLGMPLTILSLDEDTEFAILEMGMDGFGQIEFLTKLAKPHHVIITNIGEAHMEALGSRAGIAKAKFEIIQGLQENGRLFFDGDEPLLQELVAQEKGLQTTSFGFESTNDLYA